MTSIHESASYCESFVMILKSRWQLTSWRPTGRSSVGRPAKSFAHQVSAASTVSWRPTPLKDAVDSTHQTPSPLVTADLMPTSARPEDKIYVLGWTGAIGKLVAHALASKPDRPPIVLLHHKFDLLQGWEESSQTITLVKHGIKESQRGFESQAASPSFRTHNPDAPPIYHLILACRVYRAAAAVDLVAWRLRPESTITFLQSGMGFLDEINRTVFPDPSKRPHYMLGIVTHGAMSLPNFQVQQRGSGSITLTSLAQSKATDGDGPKATSSKLLPASSKYLLRNLTGAPTLCALGLYPSDFVQLKFEKLAVNAVINPLTALLGCQNGEFLENEGMVRLMRLLLAEISLVVCSLPELKNIPNVNRRFSSRSLELHVINIAKQTAEDRSSMLQDMDNARETEIEYLNGYIVRRGEELGIRCITNYMVLQMVNAKTKATINGMQEMVPFEDEI